jgi:hypothetical protein
MELAAARSENNVVPHCVQKPRLKLSELLYQPIGPDIVT